MWEFPQQYGLWYPGLISTALWLDAADATTVISSGGRISQWSDKSGNSRNATQATGAQQPKITAAAQNSRSVVEFDPASNSFQRLSFSRLTNLGHVFFVAKKNNVNDSDVVLTDGSADDLRGVIFGSGTGSNFIVQQLAPTLATATRNVWHIAEIATTGTNATVGIDAGRVTQADADLMSSSDIGWYRNANSIFVAPSSFRGQIGEIIISQSVLADSVREKIEGYLAHKWGLTANLPAGHPYKTVGPTP
jgi:hypothetical protein